MRKIRIHTIEAGAHYEIHEVVDGRQEGGVDVYGDARETARRARSLAKGAPIEWVKKASGRKTREPYLPDGAVNNPFNRVRRVGETKFELDGRVYDISKKEALYKLRDKVGVTRASDLRAELMSR